MKEIIRFSFGKETITANLSYEDRKTLSITVLPDKTVSIKAPVNRSPAEVMAYIKKRSPWIIRQQDYFDQFCPIQPERQYIGGESHYYLGRQYRLKIQQGNPAHVKLIGPFFVMQLPNPSDGKKSRQLLQDWYRTHACELMKKRLNHYLEQYLYLGAKVPEIRFRRMSKRWGSCSPNGVIMLNTQLVKAPIQCIDYVINHELCHLIFPHHNKDFYKLLNRMLPDWEKRKKRLEQVFF